MIQWENPIGDFMPAPSNPGPESLVFPVVSSIASEDALRAPAMKIFRFCLKLGGILFAVALPCLFWSGDSAWLFVMGFLLMIFGLTSGLIAWIAWSGLRKQLRSQDPPDQVSIGADQVQWRLPRDPEEGPVAWENAGEVPAQFTLSFRWDQIQKSPAGGFDLELEYGGKYVGDLIRFNLDSGGMPVPFALRKDMYPRGFRRSESRPIQNPVWLQYVWMVALIKARPDLLIAPSVYEYACVNPRTLAFDAKPRVRSNKIGMISAAVCVPVTIGLVFAMPYPPWPWWGVLGFVLGDLLLLILIMLVVSWIIPLSASQESR